MLKEIPYHLPNMKIFPNVFKVIFICNNCRIYSSVLEILYNFNFHKLFSSQSWILYSDIYCIHELITTSASDNYSLTSSSLSSFLSANYVILMLSTKWPSHTVLFFLNVSALVHSFMNTSRNVVFRG
jgi:hypothetical protein